MNTSFDFQDRWTRFLERSFNVLIPTLSIMAAFMISGFFITLWGARPLEAYAALFSGAFGSPNAWAATLTRLTPLVFTGLAVTYGYRGGFFNVGAEGQLFMGGLAAAWVGVTFVDLPAWQIIPLCILSSMLAGALLCLIPGILKAVRGFNEVLTTLLLNYIAIQYFEWSLHVDHPVQNMPGNWNWINWLGIKDPTQSYPRSAFISEAAWLPSIKDFLAGKLFSSWFSGKQWYESALNTSALERITLAPLIAILFIFLIYILLFKTTAGYHARAVGINPSAARYLGINVSQTLIVTSLISGALAGLAGGVEVLGAQHRILERYLVDAGFTGIPVALIGQLHPAGVGLSALFFGALRAGANKMQIITAVPTAVVYVIQALAILFAISGSAFSLSSRFKTLFSHSRATLPHTDSHERPHV